jgi:hypothetical protein
MPFKVTWMQYFFFPSLHTFEVDAKRAPFNMGVLLTGLKLNNFY